MSVLKIMKINLSIVFLSASLLFVSCATGKIENHRNSIRLNDSLTEKQLSSESYIFIRLYDVVYDKALRPGNFLRRPIRFFGSVPDGTAYVHSAISTYLDDDTFLGLSLSKEKNMARYEPVLDLESNDYMVTLDGKKSRCAVIAVPCAESERKTVENLLDYAGSKDSHFVYGIRKNVAAAAGHIGNLKAFSRSRNFPIEFAFGPLPMEKEPQEFFQKNVFVCSNFITYILHRSVERYRVDFMINRINFMGYTPVDLYFLDGAFEIFECEFEAYDEAVNEFVEIHPGFNRYLK